jgi:hypothetical protein
MEPGEREAILRKFGPSLRVAFGFYPEAAEAAAALEATR